MTAPVITGIGIVSPLGVGRASFWDAFAHGEPGNFRGGSVAGFRFDDYIDDRRFRRIAAVSQYALAAIKLALDDAGIREAAGETTALILGVTHGALGYTQQFHRALVQEGGEAASPLLFSDSVLNAPAGNASILFGVRGPVHTLIGGAEAGIKALMTGRELLRAGTIERVIVVSAEELNELSAHCYARLGLTALAEGAAALVIENAGARAEAEPYCAVAGAAALCAPARPAAALHAAAARCLTNAAAVAESVDLVVADSAFTGAPPLPAIPTADSVPSAGYAFAVTTLWHVALAALSLKNGAAPQALLTNKHNSRTLPERLQRTLVAAEDGAGSAAAALLLAGG